MCHQPGKVTRWTPASRARDAGPEGPARPARCPGCPGALLPTPSSQGPADCAGHTTSPCSTQKDFAVASVSQSKAGNFKKES